MEGMNNTEKLPRATRHRNREEDCRLCGLPRTPRKDGPGTRCIPCHKSRAKHNNLAKRQTEASKPFTDHCEICLSQFDPPMNGSGSTANVPHFDHDHDTGNFRGWLCGRCNRALGLLGDNPGILRKALAYLELRGNSPTRGPL